MIPYACGVDKPEKDPVDIQYLLDRIPRRTRLRGDNGAVSTQKAVEQAGFAHVRPADNRRRQALAHEAPALKSPEQLAALCRHGFKTRDETTGRDQLDIVFGKIDTGL